MSGYTAERKFIRDTLKALLLNNTNALENVFTSRADPLFKEEISSIVIYTPKDEPQRQNKFDWNFGRKVQVIMDITVQKSETIEFPEDEADLIAGQVENRILTNIHLQNPPPKAIQIPSPGDEGDPGNEIVDRIELIDVSMTKVADGIADTSGIQMEFEAIYHYETLQGSIDPFEIANIHYNLSGQQKVVDQAEDIVNLPQ